MSSGSRISLGCRLGVIHVRHAYPSLSFRLSQTVLSHHVQTQAVKQLHQQQPLT